MSHEPPTGRREDQRVEFKAAGVLKDAKQIAREVVGMLNAGGGRVWIGVPEVDGVALRPTPIDDAETKRLALLDQMIDLIAPTPAGTELAIGLVSIDNGHAIVIDVARPETNRLPFAWKTKGLYGFDRRVDHRIVPMGIDEIRRLMRGETTEDARSDALLWLDASLAQANATGISTIAFTPRDIASPSTDISKQTKESWTELIESPPRELARFNGRRIIGSLRAVSRTTDLEAKEINAIDGRGRSIVVEPNGRVAFSVPTAALTVVGDTNLPSDKPSRIHPYLVIAWLRAACHIGAWAMKEFHVRGDELVLADLRIGGAGQVAWFPYSPKSAEWHYWRGADLWDAAPKENVRLRAPVRSTVGRLVDAPDGIATALVERLYEAVGFEAEHVPFEVDPETGRFRGE